MENALVFLQRGEAGKAGELLWGSVAEALQAVATSRGMRLANHRSLRFFAGTVAKELGDASLSEGYRLAEGLHSNFYEVELEPGDIAAVVEPIRRTVSKLLDLIPPEAVQQDSQEDAEA
jgi:hypothetical protein